MSPAQNVVTGSTVDVTRSLRPYVPSDSVCHQMASRAAKEEASMMQHRLQLPHFYNVGHDEVVVPPHSYSMGMVLEKRGDDPSKGLADSGSISGGTSSGVCHVMSCLQGRVGWR